MVKTNTILCDICKERVAKDKCNLCGEDICNFRSCIRKFPVSIGGKVYPYEIVVGKIINLLYCRNCWDKKIKDLINKDDFWDETFIEKTVKSIADCIRKRLILEGLESD